MNIRLLFCSIDDFTSVTAVLFGTSRSHTSSSIHLSYRLPPMPSRPNSSIAGRKPCYCEECIENGGSNADGSLKGVQFLAAAFAGHRAAVALRKAQRAREQVEYAEQQGRRAIESMQEEVIGLVMVPTSIISLANYGLHGQNWWRLPYLFPSHRWMNSPIIFIG